MARRRSPAPRFPFGFGLSYTSFASEWRELDTRDPANIIVRATVRNTGNRAGAAVLLGDVSLPESAQPQPPKSLAAFAKVLLEPGQNREVELSLPLRQRSYDDPAKPAWIAPEGDYGIHLAWNAAEIIETRTCRMPSVYPLFGHRNPGETKDL